MSEEMMTGAAVGSIEEMMTGAAVDSIEEMNCVVCRIRKVLAIGFAVGMVLISGIPL